jgi:Leucine Rich repeat
MLPQLTSISLQGQQLGNGGICSAATALHGHTHLMHVDFRGNKLDAVGLRVLCGAAPRWPHLRALLLSDNELASTEADALAPGLRAMPQLTWLDVRCTRMTDALRAALAPLTAMQRLELGTPQVGDALTAMVHLSHLDLGFPGQWGELHDQNATHTRASGTSGRASARTHCAALAEPR